MTRHIGHRLEGAGVYAAYGLFRIMPLDMASAFGGWIGRTVGPWLPATRTALVNLARAMPERSEEERRRIVRGMWDNLGRTFAEYPHLEEIGRTRTEVVGQEHFETVRDGGRAGLFVSGHIANWEVQSVVSRLRGLELALVYRAPNNPYSDRLLKKLRGAASSVYVPKGPKGAGAILRILSAKGHVAMLIDQKLNDGIAVPFFGRDAMTAPAPAMFALRLGVPLHLTRTERLQGAWFRVTVLPASPVPATGDRESDIHAMMTAINAQLESWIRERPEQWLWIHRRWPG